MTFAHPLLLLATFAAAAFFVWLALAGVRRSRAAALAYSDLAFLERAIGRGVPWTALFVAAWALAIVAGGVALARPSIVAAVPVHDAAVVLCIDTSGSMASSDVLPTRSEASRAAAQAFINAVPDGTRIGIVAFSSNAVPLGPLTDDRSTALDELSRLPPPNGGTAIGDAMGAAADLLPARGSRVIVLVTDGVNNAGTDPEQVAGGLGALGITIFTIGIGTNGSGMTIPGTEEDAALDEDTLRAIAQSGHGSYARVADAAALRERLGAIAHTTVNERRRVDVTMPVALAAGGLALAATLSALLLGRFP